MMFMREHAMGESLYIGVGEQTSKLKACVLSFSIQNIIMSYF